jgi:UDP-N-acetylglucosamine acyltransferase
MSVIIAQSAVVDPRAVLDADVRIGPFCVIGPHVHIGRGTRLENNVTITGHTTIGVDNHFHTGVVIGREPQDLSYRGSPTRVVIGDRNVLREYATIHRASEKENGVTQLGSNCYLMVGAHIAHDCVVGDRVVLANNVMLGGHVHVDHDAILSGGVGVHHFTSIGAYAFAGGMARVIQDVPPFMLVEGTPARPRCLNIVGLKRNDFSAEDIRSLNEAYRLLYRSKVGIAAARKVLFATGPVRPVLTQLFDFLEHQCGGRNGRGRDRRKAA